MNKVFTKVAVLMSCCLLACSSSNTKPLSIQFSADSSTIIISNIDRPGLLQLKDLNLTDSSYSELISVLQTPTELDSSIREEPIAGKYIVSDSNIVFSPKMPFVKNRTYLIITHINAKFGDAEQIVKSSLSTGIKPQEQLLKR
ncbi:hypothetical protein ACVWYN_000531 [Pedobacter sp. UYP24]